MTAWAEVARLISRQYGVVTRDQARAFGLSDGAIKPRIASGLWVKRYPSVFRDVAVPVSWHQELKALTLRKAGRIWISHRAAAAFWALDGFEAERIEAITDSDVRSRERGVGIHRVSTMPASDVTTVRGIPLTTVSRTLLDLGLIADVNAVELALECALRRGIVTVPRLTRRLEYAAGRGRKGPSVLRNVLRRRGIDVAPTESVLETRFLQFLRRYNLPVPDRQVRISHADGVLARVDFFYSAAGVVVEVESLRHHFGRADWESDLRRRNLLTMASYRVVHVTHERITRDHDRLACELRAVIHSLGPRGR
jgi:very-short-patch-repair endonuclease